jgi:hypothetical protein
MPDAEKLFITPTHSPRIRQQVRPLTEADPFAVSGGNKNRDKTNAEDTGC